MVPFGEENFAAFFDHAKIISKRYAPAHFGGRHLLVLAEGNPNGAAVWEPYLTGAGRVTSLDCEHSSLLREPHARSVADVVAHELRESGR